MNHLRLISSFIARLTRCETSLPTLTAYFFHADQSSSDTRMDRGLPTGGRPRRGFFLLMKKIIAY